MLDWLPILVIMLATWRVASIIVQEDGPLNVFRRLRGITGVEHDPVDGKIQWIPDRGPAKLFTCLWCMSVWVGAAMYGIWLVAPVLVWILAISTGAILIDRHTGERDA